MYTYDKHDPYTASLPYLDGDYSAWALENDTILLFHGYLADSHKIKKNNNDIHHFNVDVGILTDNKRFFF